MHGFCTVGFFVGILCMGWNCFEMRGKFCIWIFDDDWGVVANAQFQKEDALSLVTAQKFTVSLCRTVPSFVLYKGK